MCKISIDQFANNPDYKKYLNEHGIITAIDNAISIMTANIGKRWLLHTDKYFLNPFHEAEYEGVIDEMNKERLPTLDTEDPLLASVFLKAFLNGMSAPLLPNTVCDLTKAELSPRRVAHALLDRKVLSDQHLVFFVYIFNFLIEYWRYPHHPYSAISDDDRQQSDISLDDMAKCMTPCITHLGRTDEQTTPGARKKRKNAKNMEINLQKYENAFKYVLKHFNPILEVLEANMHVKRIILAYVKPYKNE